MKYILNIWKSFVTWFVTHMIAASMIYLMWAGFEFFNSAPHLPFWGAFIAGTVMAKLGGGK